MWHTIDHANGKHEDIRSYLQAVHVGTTPSDHWTAGSWYDCHYQRTPQGWKLTRVKLTSIWQSGEVKAIRPEA